MLYLGPSTIAGRGVFTDVQIEAGEVFHRADILMLDGEAATQLRQYVYDVDGRPGMALSLAAMLNHDRNPNTAFRVNAAACVLELAARRRLSAGEELTVNYADYAGVLGLS